MANKPRNHCFLGCFGFSRKIPVKVVDSSDNMITSKKSETSAGLFSWSRFCIKSVSAVKTVPIDTSGKTANQSESKAHSSKSKSKLCKFLWLFTKRHNLKATTSFQEFPAVVKVAKDQTPKEIFQVEETRQVPQQNIILKNPKSLDHHLDSSKGDTCQKRLSFHRKIDAIRTCSSKPGSPDFKAKPVRTTSTLLSHSDSLLAPAREKQRSNPSSQTRAVPKKIRRDGDNIVTVNKFDPVVGVSIIMVTLIIMLIWGRLCAILCTSAWFYIVPRLKASSKNDDVMRINGGLDYNSEEYKKRVVLDGFLERDHRLVVL